MRLSELVRAYVTRLDLLGAERTCALQRGVDFHVQIGLVAERLLNPHRHPIDLVAPLSGVVLLALVDTSLRR